MKQQVPDQSGRTFVITGANSGLGLETAKKLGAAGGHVVLAVRDTSKGQTAARQVPGSTEVRELDLADLASVRAFAQAWTTPIDVLVNNAGIMMVAEGRTADGFERQIGTNHLGHFALTNLLLPQVSDRVVTLSSGLHHGPQVAWTNLDLDGGHYSPTRAYQQSKLANLLFTSELQRRLTDAGSPVRAMAAHPGFSATNLSKQSHALIKAAVWIGNRLVATSAEFGSRPTVHAALADLPGDTFIGPTKLFGSRGAPGPNRRSPQAQDAEAAQHLWAVSEERTGVTWPLT